jgi:hypothetical protein
LFDRSGVDIEFSTEPIEGGVDLPHQESIIEGYEEDPIPD